MGATETVKREPEPDREPEPGDHGRVTRNGRAIYVVEEHPHTAGEIYSGGRSLAHHLDVAADRRVVWTVYHDDLAGCNLDGDSHADVVRAIREGIVLPTPVPVSLVAPMAEAEAEVSD